MSKHAFAERFAAGRIDEEAGIIYGVSLATEGPARGHGCICDRTTLEQLRDCAKAYSGGLKVKMTHQGDAGDIVGFLANLRIEGKKLLGDLHLLQNYEKRAYILELAQKIPDTFGLSVAFSGPSEERGGMECARCAEIYSCDLVSEPAANPSGLFSQGVDAGGAGNSQPEMTPDEIKTHVQSAVQSALVEFGGRIKAIEDGVKALAPSTELSALKTELKELSAKLDTAKTELGASIGDEKSRLELAAKAVAVEFTRHTGRTNVNADGGGAGGNGGGVDAVKEFDAKLTKAFEVTKSKVNAWRQAMDEDPKGYAAFIAAKAKPSFEKSAAK